MSNAPESTEDPAVQPEKARFVVALSPEETYELTDEVAEILAQCRDTDILDILTRPTLFLQRLDASGRNLVLHAVVKWLRTGYHFRELAEIWSWEPLYRLLQDSEGNSVLHLLARRGFNVLEHRPASDLIKYGNKYGNTPLHWMARFHQHHDSLRDLPVEWLNIQNNRGESVLEVLERTASADKKNAARRKADAPAATFEPRNPVPSSLFPETLPDLDLNAPDADSETEGGDNDTKESLDDSSAPLEILDTPSHTSTAATQPELDSDTQVLTQILARCIERHEGDVQAVLSILKTRGIRVEDYDYAVFGTTTTDQCRAFAESRRCLWFRCNYDFFLVYGSLGYVLATLSSLVDCGPSRKTTYAR